MNEVTVQWVDTKDYLPPTVIQHAIGMLSQDVLIRICTGDVIQANLCTTAGKTYWLPVTPPSPDWVSLSKQYVTHWCWLPQGPADAEIKPAGMRYDRMIDFTAYLRKTQPGTKPRCLVHDFSGLNQFKCGTCGVTKRTLYAEEAAKLYR